MTAEMHARRASRYSPPRGRSRGSARSSSRSAARGDASRGTAASSPSPSSTRPRWRDVKITREAFDPSSGLYSDLDILESINGYSHVRLRLSFAPDLPAAFYPPVVSVTRPRFVGDAVPGACAAHPMLHLRNWRPLTPVASVVGKLRRFLQRHARVDLASERNDPEAFPRGAYSDEVSELENAVARLAARGTSRGPAITPRHFRDLYDAMTPESDEDDVEDEDNNAARYVDPDRGPEGSEGVAANGDEGKDAGKRRKGKGAAEMASGTKKKRGERVRLRRGVRREGGRPDGSAVGERHRVRVRRRREQHGRRGRGERRRQRRRRRGRAAAAAARAVASSPRTPPAARRADGGGRGGAPARRKGDAVRGARAHSRRRRLRAAAGPAGAASSAEAGRSGLANPPGGGEAARRGGALDEPFEGKETTRTRGGRAAARGRSVRTLRARLRSRSRRVRSRASGRR